MQCLIGVLWSTFYLSCGQGPNDLLKDEFKCPTFSAQNNLDLLVDYIAGQKMSWSILNGYTQALILSQLVAITEGKLVKNHIKT